MEIEITETAEQDLERLDNLVRDTFYSKVQSIKKNLDIGASPGQAFNKYLGGNMNPVLQMNLGRDFRAWFLEGKYLPDNFDENTVYCMMILTKKEAKSLTKKIKDPVSFLQSDL
jgi:mRNA-degrading endonuclease RelE of RelBE toxin-antitoxin system